MNASLNEMLENVEWGEYNYEELFKLVPIKRKLDKSFLNINKKTPVFSSESTNNGIIGYTNINADYIINKDVPIYVIFGDHTRCFNIATENFCVADNVKVLKPKIKFSMSALMFIVSSWKKCIPNKGYSRHWSIAEKSKIQLPTKNGSIDFDFMERFITELEAERITKLAAYLKANGLHNYELSEEEKEILHKFENLDFGEFTYDSIFNRIEQGRRLKKDDQIPGNIPFVMAGITNNGVANYVSNPVAFFPKNSITIDIFGNSFYRGYDFGAGDDTGVYWNDKIQYSKEVMLFLTAAMERSIKGKFSYGKKLRSSQSLNFKMTLPTKNGNPDFEAMDLLISAVQKLVIKDVVLYTYKKIEATKTVVEAKN